MSSSDAHARCFDNALPDYQAGALDWDVAGRRIEAHANALRRTLAELTPDVLRDGVEGFDVYTGLGGLAMMELHHWELLSSTSRHSEQSLKRSRDLEAAAVKLAAGHRQVPTFLLGQAGVHALSAVSAHLSGDVTRRNNAVSMLTAFASSSVMRVDSALPSEVLYGRAGYLFACAFVNSRCKEALVPDAVLLPVIADVLAIGRRGAQELARAGGALQPPHGAVPPLMFSWHGKLYLGAAHGLAGVIQMLLLHRRLLSQPEYQDTLASLDWLLEHRYSSGNFPSSLDVSGLDRLVQWCHGAPGAALTLCTAYSVTGDVKYLHAARAACDVVWERGLVSKLGLCHGVAGNMYPFLSLRRAELLAVARGHAPLAEQRPERALHRARMFGLFLVVGAAPLEAAGVPAAAAGSSSSAVHGARPGEPAQAHWQALVASGRMHGGDRPASLMEGAAGVAFALEDLLHPDQARFPGYEL